MPYSRRALLAHSIALLTLPAWRGLAGAQAWPTQPIRIVVTFPPGGSSDTVARLIAPPLSEKLGQPVVVENKPGGAATIGAAFVAKAPADGYTLLMSNSTPMTISPSLMPTMLYDPVKNFQHLAYVGEVPTVLVVHPSLPVTDFASFIRWAKAQPDPVPFSSGGAASVGHIVGGMLAQQAGLKLLHIPYRGAGPMRSDLLGGQIKVAIDALPQTLAFHRSGQLRLLAVTSDRRVTQAPDIPTVVELGYPKLVAENWVGVSAPTGMPEPVARALSQALSQVLASPDIRAKLQAQGYELQTKSPAEFAAFVKAQGEAWAPVVKASGATL
jgi:tripartite-type tricarboxylate transporter receptor subunit TctC